MFQVFRYKAFLWLWVKCIPKYFTLFDTITNVNVLISFLDYSFVNTMELTCVVTKFLIVI